MTLLLSFAAVLPRLLLGFCSIHLIWRASDGRSLMVKIFLSAGVGFGISSLLGFLWIWAGLPLAAYVVLESLMILALAGWMFTMHRPRLESTDRPDPAWTLLLAAGFFLFALNLALYALQYPHGRPDAWINWNVAARFIYLGGADWRVNFLRQFDHPDYPLFMAVTNAVTWVFLQKTSTWGPIAFHFVLSICTAGLLFSLINFFRDFKQAVLGVTLFISLPFVVDQGMRQYADLLLAYLILAAGGLTLLYIRTKETSLPILTGLLIGLGGWAKNEGLPAILGVSLVWGLLAWQREARPAFRNYLFGLALPLLVIILFKLFLAPSNDLMSVGGSSLPKLLEADRYATILQTGGAMLWNLGGTPVPWIGLIILLAVFIGRSTNRTPGLWLVGIVIGFQMAVYFGIYLLTPLELVYHLNTSLDRLYMHILPLAFLWLFFWLKSPQELTSEKS